MKRQYDHIQEALHPLERSIDRAWCAVDDVDFADLPVIGYSLARREGVAGRRTGR